MRKYLPHRGGEIKMKREKMMTDSEILETLTDLGFTERQAKVYLVLNKKTYASLADLQKLTGIRQDKLGEVLNILIAEGFCSEKKIGRKRIFSITNPKTSLSKKIKNFENRIKKAETLSEVLQKMYLNTEDTKEPFEYIEVFYGNDNIHDNYCELVRNSNHEILSFTREPFAYHNEEKKAEQEKVITDFLKRKGKVKTVFEEKLLENNPQLVQKLLKKIDGDEVKVTVKLPLKMFIFDNSTLLIADAAPLNISNELRMVLIKQQTIINAFSELFKFFWNQATEISKWEKNKKGE